MIKAKSHHIKTGNGPVVVYLTSCAVEVILVQTERDASRIKHDAEGTVIASAGCPLHGIIIQDQR